MQRIVQAPPPQRYHFLRANQASYRDLGSDPSIRLALWEEQGRRCAYCERRLKNPTSDGHKTRIEHFHPQHSATWGPDCSARSGAKDESVAPTTWANMMLCCDGNESIGSEYTCDKLKGNAHICERLWSPKTSPQLACLVEVDLLTGRVSAKAGLPTDADDVIETVLRLNAEHLVEARKRVIRARQRSYVQLKNQHHGVTQARRAQIAAQLRAEAEGTAEYATTLRAFAAQVERL